MNNELRTIKTKPKQTQFKSEGRSEKWNVSRNSYDLYYITMRKSRDQIYDELLVLKCQAGDKNAFEELVKRWEKRLWHYAYKVTGAESTAWDIVQETWLAIVKGIRRLDEAALFPRWVFRILNNKCADWLRKQHMQSQLHGQLAKKAQNESNIKQNSHEKVDSLQAAITKLQSDQRALLMLRYHENFDISQIAEILCVPEGTVKSRLNRILTKLRQIMGQE